MSSEFKEDLPTELVAHVLAMCGERGERWFAGLPAVIAELERDWGISIGRPFPGIEYNYVAEAARNVDGVPVVIKIAPPFETTEIFGEAKYLRLHHGKGCVDLLAEDRGRKAILLERALPGLALHESFQASPIDCLDPAIDVLNRILRPPPDDMTDVPTLDGWFDNFRSFRDTAFPVKLAEQAFEIYGRLSKQTDRVFYLHGDFHLGNVVTGSREAFQAIDPKGIVGHVGYDIAVFLINLERWQRENEGLDQLLKEAAKRFARAFDLTDTDVREWVFAHMVIGAWWNFSDMPDLYDPEVALPAIWLL